VQLLSVPSADARTFYEAEAIRGGWSVRQLNRQISTQFYERTSHSKRRAAMLAKGQTPKPEDAMTVEDEVRDPYLLEFLDLKTGAFTHADAGQMGLYLSYAKRHLTLPDEADPAGIVLCSEKDDAVVEYALGEMRANVFASKYLSALPDKETLRQEILRTQRALAARQEMLAEKKKRR
jgi:hypothetical protein